MNIPTWESSCTDVSKYNVINKYNTNTHFACVHCRKICNKSENTIIFNCGHKHCSSCINIFVKRQKKVTYQQSCGCNNSTLSNPLDIPCKCSQCSFSVNLSDIKDNLVNDLSNELNTINLNKGAIIEYFLESNNSTEWTIVTIMNCLGSDKFEIMDNNLNRYEKYIYKEQQNKTWRISRTRRWLDKSMIFRPNDNYRWDKRKGWQPVFQQLDSNISILPNFPLEDMTYKILDLEGYYVDTHILINQNNCWEKYKIKSKYKKNNSKNMFIVSPILQYRRVNICVLLSKENYNKTWKWAYGYCLYCNESLQNKNLIEHHCIECKKKSDFVSMMSKNPEIKKRIQRTYPYYICEPARSNRSKCKYSGEKIKKGELRIAQVYFIRGSEWKFWYLPDQFFKKLKNARKHRIVKDGVKGLEGYSKLTKIQKEKIRIAMEKHEEWYSSKHLKLNERDKNIHGSGISV